MDNFSPFVRPTRDQLFPKDRKKDAANACPAEPLILSLTHRCGPSVEEAPAFPFLFLKG
jgi:hypothetical protein